MTERHFDNAELEAVMADMAEASTSLTAWCANHPFSVPIAISRLMGTYFGACRHAMRHGVDFTQASTHTDVVVPQGEATRALGRSSQALLETFFATAPQCELASADEAQVMETARSFDDLSAYLYAHATRIANHPFIEFCGLINEWVVMVRQSIEAGHDPLHGAPDWRAHNLHYVAEKLDCITAAYCPGVAYERARDILARDDDR